MLKKRALLHDKWMTIQLESLILICFQNLSESKKDRDKSIRAALQRRVVKHFVGKWHINTSWSILVPHVQGKIAGEQHPHFHYINFQFTIPCVIHIWYCCWWCIRCNHRPKNINNLNYKYCIEKSLQLVYRKKNVNTNLCLSKIFFFHQETDNMITGKVTQQQKFSSIFESLK